MHITLSAGRAQSTTSDLLLLATTRAHLTADTRLLDPTAGSALRQLIKHSGFAAHDGTALLFQVHGPGPLRFIVLAGVSPDSGRRTWHQLADLAVRNARELKAARVTIAFGAGLLSPAAIAGLAEGLQLGAYRFERFKSKPSRRDHPQRVALLVTSLNGTNRAALRRGQLFASGTCYARDLITTPAAEITPSRLAQEAIRLARQHRLHVRVHDQRALTRLGMGAILGVAQGSAQPPRLIELRYSPRGRAKKTIAIVGKGITFDSGGLSLKNPEAMQGQKRDMAGGAAVLGVMSVIADLAPAVEVRGYIAAAENMPSGHAIRPGDVLRAYNGTTIEVLNTDAEGRLVLADALAYATKAKPDVIIDLATLTAAVGAALGRRYAGIMGTNAALTRAVIAAGKRAAENLWELPLVDDYRPDIASKVADIKNTGEGYAGTIIGGLFLREFVGKVPWAHIDFYSTVVTDKPFPAHPGGATGFGVRTLLEYITAL